MADDTDKKQGNGFFATLIDTAADRGSPVATAIQAKFYPEDYSRRQEHKAMGEELARLKVEEQRLRNQSAQLDYDFNKAINPHRIAIMGAQRDQAGLRTTGLQLDNENKEIKKQFNLLQFQQVQQKVWSQNSINDSMQTRKKIYDKYGVGHLNDMGQNIMANSRAVEAFCNTVATINAFKRSEEEGLYIARKNGLDLQRNKNGEYDIKLPDGSLIPLNQDGIKAISSKIQQDMKIAISAASTMGGPAASIPQAAIKIKMSDVENKRIFGSNENAMKQMQEFLFAKLTDPKTGKTAPLFTDDQLTTFYLSTALKGALKDNMLDAEEIKTLTPLFDATVRQRGGEVRWGSDANSTMVVIGRESGHPQEIPLSTYASILEQRDEVTPRWNQYRQSVATKAQQAQQAQQTQLSPEQWNAYHSLYGSPFAELNEKQELAFAQAALNTTAFEASRIPQGTKIQDLDLETLRMLDNRWKEEINKADLNENVFYSPYQNEIYLREREDLYKQKQALIRGFHKVPLDPENTSVFAGDPFVGQEHRNLQINTGSTKRTSIKRQMKKIDEAIEKREKELSRRGVKFKEYK